MNNQIINQINEEILNENIAFQNIVNDFINKTNYHFPLSAEEYLNLEKNHILFDENLDAIFDDLMKKGDENKKTSLDENKCGMLKEIEKLKNFNYKYTTNLSKLSFDYERKVKEELNKISDSI